MICSRHRVTHLSYVDRHELAIAHFRAGLRQKECLVCHLWFWPWEMEELPPLESSGFRWVFEHPGLWMLWDCDSDHHCGWIHMDRPGRWEAYQSPERWEEIRRRRHLGAFPSAPEAAVALMKAVKGSTRD